MKASHSCVLAQSHVGDAERAADAVIRIGAALLVLGALEVGQHVARSDQPTLPSWRQTSKSCAWPRT